MQKQPDERLLKHTADMPRNYTVMLDLLHDDGMTDCWDWTSHLANTAVAEAEGLGVQSPVAVACQIKC